jgi:hypothetical protein
MAIHNPQPPGSWAAAAAPGSQQKNGTDAGNHRREAEIGRSSRLAWIGTAVFLALFAISLVRGMPIAAVLTGAVAVPLAVGLVIDQRKRAALRRR